jgi:hypothetical protein
MSSVGTGTVDRASRAGGWTSTVGVALAAIWLSTVAAALFAPDMVTGSAHERLPIAAMTGWVWAIVATGYVLMGARGGRSAPGLVLGTTVTWAIVGIAVVFGPALVTGSDPTTIPLTAMLAPVAGAVVTGFLALDNATR